MTWRGRPLAPVVALAAALAVLSSPPLLAAVAQEGDPEPVQRRLARGLEHLEDGDPERALAELREALEVAPDHAAVHYYAAGAHRQLQRLPAAYRHFARAAELRPGWGEAHRWACVVAFWMHDYEAAWQQCIRAAQAGEDVQQAFEELSLMVEGPPGWRQVVSAPRLFVAAVDLDALLRSESGPFAVRDQAADPEEQGADVRGRGVQSDFFDQAVPEAGLPFSTGGPVGPTIFAMPASGSELVARVQAELVEVNRQFGRLLAESGRFGVVADPPAADWIFRLVIQDATDAEPRRVTGFVKLFDPRDGEEVYSRNLELSNTASVPDIRNDAARYVGYMERWLREREGGPG